MVLQRSFSSEKYFSAINLKKDSYLGLSLVGFCYYFAFDGKYCRLPCIGSDSNRLVEYTHRSRIELCFDNACLTWCNGFFGVRGHCTSARAFCLGNHKWSISYVCKLELSRYRHTLLNFLEIVCGFFPAK